MGCLEFVDAPDQEFVEVAQVHDESQLGSITFWDEECWAGPWSCFRGSLYDPFFQEGGYHLPCQLQMVMWYSQCYLLVNFPAIAYYESPVFEVGLFLPRS